MKSKISSTLLYNKEDGAQKIVYEELMYSNINDSIFITT